MKFKIIKIEKQKKESLDDLEVTIDSDVLDEIHDRVLAGSGLHVDYETIFTAIELVYRWSPYLKREVKHITKEHTSVIRSTTDAMAGIYLGMDW